VLWSPAFFGGQARTASSRGGSIVAAPMGDPNRLDPDAAAPCITSRCSRAYGKIAHGLLGGVYVEGRRLPRGLAKKLGHREDAVSGRKHPVEKISKKSMIHNDATPNIEVDPENLRGSRRRRTPDLPAGRGAAHGAAVFHVLGSLLTLSPCGRGWPRCEASRAGVRGYALSIDLNPSPGSHLGDASPPSPTRGEG